MLLCVHQRDEWTFNACVRPIAEGYPDGKVYRSSPAFTFASINNSSQTIMLGSHMFAETNQGSTFLCRVVSIFEHTDSAGVKTRACYVYRYHTLQSLSKSIAGVAVALRANIGNDRQLVLDTSDVNAIMLKGDSLDWLRRKICVVQTIAEFRAKEEAFLFQYALEEDNVLRPLKSLYLLRPLCFVLNSVVSLCCALVSFDV